MINPADIIPQDQIPTATAVSGTDKVLGLVGGSSVNIPVSLLKSSTNFVNLANTSWDIVGNPLIEKSLTSNTNITLTGVFANGSTRGIGYFKSNGYTLSINGVSISFGSVARLAVGITIGLDGFVNIISEPVYSTSSVTPLLTFLDDRDSTVQESGGVFSTNGTASGWTENALDAKKLPAGNAGRIYYDVDGTTGNGIIGFLTSHVKPSDFTDIFMGFYVPVAVGFNITAVHGTGSGGHTTADTGVAFTTGYKYGVYRDATGAGFLQSSPDGVTWTTIYSYSTYGVSSAAELSVGLCLSSFSSTATILIKNPKQTGLS